MPLVDAQIAAGGCLVFVTVHVSTGRIIALTAAGQAQPFPVNGTGLVDSGASNSMIDVSVVQRLGLQPTGQTSVLTAAGSTPSVCNQYDVSVWFPQAPTLIKAQPVPHPVHLTLPVTESDFSAQGFHVLIGRDILARRVFIYNVLCC